MLLALANRPAPMEGAGSPARGGGSSAPRASGSSAEQVLSRLIPVVASLERKVGDLSDRSSIVFVVKDESMKEAITQIRDLWKSQDKLRRDAHEAKGADDGSDMADHPLGGPLRCVIFRTVLELIAKEVPADHPSKRLLTAGAETTTSDYLSTVFRCNPRHPTYREGRPWVWCVLLHERLPEAMLALITALKGLRLEKIATMDQHTADGPLLKWLLDWQRNLKKGDAGGADGRRGKRSRQ